MGNGYREAGEGDLFICLYDARTAGVILPCARVTRTPRGMNGSLLWITLMPPSRAAT
jgi:hypothetical protein